MEYNLSGKEYIIINDILVKSRSKEKALENISKFSDDRLSQIKPRTLANSSQSILNFLDIYVKLRDEGLLLPLGQANTQLQTQSVAGMQVMPSGSITNDPNWKIPTDSDYFACPPENWKPLTEQERWTIADEWIKNKRQKLTAEQAEKCLHKRWNYPFFINPYKKISLVRPHEDLDVKLLIYMIERNVVGRVEFETLLNRGAGERQLLTTKTDIFDAYNLIPAHYSEFTNMPFFKTLEAAEERICDNYLFGMDEEAINEKLANERMFYKSYFNYLVNGIGEPNIHPKNLEELVELQNRVEDNEIEDIVIGGNKISVILKEEDLYGNSEYSYTFDTELDMCETLVWIVGVKPTYCKFFHIPEVLFDTCSFDVMGKTYGLIDVLKIVYKANPKGSPHYPFQSFFRGFKEAMDVGFIEFRGGMWEKKMTYPSGKFIVAPFSGFYY